MLVEIVHGSIPYRDQKGQIPTTIMKFHNIILNLNVAELIEKNFPKEMFSPEAQEFVQLCLNKLETRPKYDGLMETNFYKKYAAIDLEDREKIVAECLRRYK